MKNQIASGYILLATVLISLGGASPASAFTSGDATTLFNSWNNAFYVGNGGNAYYKHLKSGGIEGFWTQAECIEVAIDNFDRTGSSGTRDQVTALLNGFSSRNGTNWAGNSFNDDIMWACMAYIRAGLKFNNATFKNIAKTNFDMCYARAWDTNAGGLWWTTAKTSKNSCVQGPGSIAAYFLYQSTGDVNYLNKAKAINDWQRANCYDEATGLVYDTPTNHGATTYNQGTFIRACYNRGSTGGAQKACDYLMTMGGTIINGYHIMPQYDINGDVSGFNGIAVRQAVVFMKSQGLQSRYLGWLQTNAQAAWDVRRTSDNLSWCKWGVATTTADISSWTASASVAAVVNVPPTQ